MIGTRSVHGRPRCKPSTFGRGLATKVLIACSLIAGGLATMSCATEPIRESTIDPRPVATASRAGSTAAARGTTTATATATAVITSIMPTEVIDATDLTGGSDVTETIDGTHARRVPAETDTSVVEGETDDLPHVTPEPSRESDAAPDPTSASSPDPVCRPPVEDYARVEVAGETLNRRTVTMLETAMEIYAGPADLKRVAQGSYTDAVEGSFGTHDGGGAVDLSIRNPAAPAERLFEEVPAMIQALRQAGFAAWYRDWNEVFPGSVPHIHAIAIGDAELSEAARLQLDGPAGYLRGFNGLPVDPPVADGHGGPVVCDWMESLALDLR